MRRPVTAIVVLAFIAPACQQDTDQREISEALGQIVTALEAADWSSLWAVSHPEAQQQVLDLHRSLHGALDVVGEIYESAEQPIARAALGRDLVAGIPVDAKDVGPRLLSRLFAAGAIRLDEKARDGLKTTRATIDGDRGIVHTTAGEVFTFGRADGQWRSRLLIDILNQSRPIATLRESAVAIQTAVEERRRAWATSRDPAEPQGAYNLVRFALERTPVNAAVTYALLDSEAKGALVEALTNARTAQTRIQRRTPKRQRDTVYARNGITLHVGADSDRALFEAWAASETFVPPIADASRPVRVEAAPDGKTATVVTASERKVAMIRDEEGGWRLDGYAGTIRKTLGKPARGALVRFSDD